MVDSVSIIANDPAQTGRVAAAVAPWLAAGDVLILTGALAAGKTCFVQALVQALGSGDPVQSPTFAIANFYETAAAPFIHVDAYRLSGPQEYADLGLDEFAETGILAVEWGDRVLDAFDEYLMIDLAFDPSGEDARRIALTPVGARWLPVAAGLRDAGRRE